MKKKKTVKKLKKNEEKLKKLYTWAALSDDDLLAVASDAFRVKKMKKKKKKKSFENYLEKMLSKFEKKIEKTEWGDPCVQELSVRHDMVEEIYFAYINRKK